MAQLDLSPSVPSSIAVPGNLSNEQRQIAVAVLRSRDRPLALADLAEDVVRARQDDPDAEPDYETVRRLRLELHHTHVPRLADAGLVTFDPSRRTVRYAGDDHRAVESSTQRERAEP